MTAPNSKEQVTALLRAWTAGDLPARERVVALLYDELRRRASVQLRRERAGHTLQPTALVHEAYLRLADQHGIEWENRTQFFAVASQMMRRILVDRARARQAAKREGQWTQMALDDLDTLPTLPQQVSLLHLDDALQRLAAIDPRKARIAELRFFGGLTGEEVGQVLGLSSKTIQRDWQAARALLFKMLVSPAERRRP